MVETCVEARALDDLQLKGFNHPVLAMESLSWHDQADDVADAAAARASG